MPDHFEYDVFLSHNKADKPQVRRLAERFKAAGARVWFDEWVIKAGDDIYLAIEHGLEAARVQVLCLSQAALGSDWVALERSTVLFRDPGNKGRRFVPVLLGDCDLPDTLRRYKYVDFREESEAAVLELLAVCSSETESVPSALSPEPQKKPTTRKPISAKQPPESEPLAELERQLIGHKHWVSCVEVSPDGKWLVSGSRDKMVRIWDMHTGECRSILKGHGGGVLFVSFSTTSDCVVSSGEDGTIGTWDVEDGSIISRLWTDTGHVDCVREVNDGKQLLICGSSCDIGLWDKRTKKLVRRMEGHEEPILSMALVKSVNQVVSASFDQTLRLWSLESGECIATLKGHTEKV